MLGGLLAAWSLAVEISFYAALPLLVLLMERPFMGRTRAAKIRSELILLAVLYLGAIRSGCIVRANEGGGPGLEPLLHAGRQLRLVRARDVPGAGERLGRRAWSGRPRWCGSLSGCPSLAWLVAAVLFWAIATQMGIGPEFPQAYTSEEWLYEHLFYGAIAFFLLLPAVFGDSLGGLPRVILRNRVLAWLGLISYGIFLWHQPIVGEIAKRDWGDWRFAGHHARAPSRSRPPVPRRSYYVVRAPAAALQGPLTQAEGSGSAG